MVCGMTKTLPLLLSCGQLIGQETHMGGNEAPPYALLIGNRQVPISVLPVDLLLGLILECRFRIEGPLGLLLVYTVFGRFGKRSSSLTAC